MGRGARTIGAALSTALLPGLATTLRARADDATEPVRIAYDAPSGCPSTSWFVAAVSARTTRARIAEPSERARTFVVVLDETARGAAGNVTIRGLDGRELRRDVSGATCAEVAETLALVVALAIDPRASLAPVALPVASAPVVATPSASVSAPTSPSAAPPPTTIPTPAMPSPAARRAVAPRPRARLSFSLGAGASLATGVTPATLAGLDVFGEARLAGSSWRAPFFRVAFQRTASDTLAEQGANVRFVWTVVRGDACLRGWRVGPVALSPCARVEGGSLFVQGGGVDRPRSDTRTSLALAPAANLRWPIGDTLFVDANAALRVAVFRDAFFFEPNPPFYEQPVLGVGLGVGFGASF